MVPFVKLKEGVHQFHFALGKPFFEAFENSDIWSANVQVDMELEKFPHLMNVTIAANGFVEVECDRCLTGIQMPINTKYRLIYKQGGKEIKADDAELVVLKPTEIEMDVSLPIYETVLLQLPMLKNCDLLNEKPCNKEMLEKLEKLKPTGEEQSDPRWDKLKDLLK